MPPADATTGRWRRVSPGPGPVLSPAHLRREIMPSVPAEKPAVGSGPTISAGAPFDLRNRQNEVFFAAVETTRMPMIVTDPNRPDNPIIFANPAFLAMTG